MSMMMLSSRFAPIEIIPIFTPTSSDIRFRYFFAFSGRIPAAARGRRRLPARHRLIHGLAARNLRKLIRNQVELLAIAFIMRADLNFIKSIEHVEAS